jgi:NADPH:quinone reductase-like Zn-dependent oxidoreductase
MKAVVYERYGPPDVLQLKNIEKPKPKDNEILIKVYSTTVTAGDWRMRKAEPFIVRFFSGLFRPKRVKILGFELAGVVEDVGLKVKSFKKGDAVFASCGFKFGGYAEYRCLPENNEIALKPSNMTFDQAAAVPIGGLTAIRLLRQAGAKSGDNLLVYGASGSVGTFAVQLAKYFGANVTAVCSSANLDLVRSLGAELAIDYTKDDFTKVDKRFDIIFDAVAKTSKSKFTPLLKPGGKFVTVGSSPKSNPDDLLKLKEIIEGGHLKSVIDRKYRLEQIREAHAYVEQFRKKGNVIVTVFEGKKS